MRRNLFDSCDPACVSASGHALLVGNPVEVLIGEVLPLAILIVPNKSEAKLIHSHRQKVSIPSLANFVSILRELLSFCLRAVLPKNGHLMKTMTEVRELLATNPASSVHEYGLSDEDANILRVGHTEEDRVSRLAIDVSQDSCGSGGAVPRIGSPSAHGSAAIANGLTTNFSPYFFLEINCYCSRSAPEAVRNRDHLRAPRRPARFPYQGRSRLVKSRPLCGSKTRAPVRLTVTTIPNAPGPFCRRRPGDGHPLMRPLILSTASAWKEYVEHTFMKGLGKGLLDKRCFVHFIRYVECTYYTPWPGDLRR